MTWRSPDGPLPGPARVPALDRTVAAVVFDWDGTAVPDRHASARAVRRRVESLSALGIHTAVVSGTHLGNIDGQLGARPAGPGRLFLGLNRGSELFEVTAAGPQLLGRREETPELRSALDRSAGALAERLRANGLEVEVVAGRLNRCKVDLIPEPEWADPPKPHIAELLDAVTDRLHGAGFASLADVARLGERVARRSGLEGARITSDGKHLEIGLTDKSESALAVYHRLERLGVSGELVLVVGDEFAELGGLPGSDARMIPADGPGPMVVSVGVEPGRLPAGVRHPGGGPPAFLALLDEQLRRAVKLRVPGICHDPRWTIVERGVDAARHRVSESLFTVTTDAVGLRGSVEESPEFGRPLVVAAGVYSGSQSGDGLLQGPDLLDVRLTRPVRKDVRTLDLRTGVLHREETSCTGAPLRSVRFGSIVEPGVFAVRVEAAADRLRVPPADEGSAWLARAGAHGGLGAVSEQHTCRDHHVRSMQRLVSVDASSLRAPREEVARERLAGVTEGGFERLLAGQRSSWAARWERAGVDIPDDPATELGLRFALFQLWSLAQPDAELAVGARGMTGSGYSGHVFWDADAFVLPALASIAPEAAAAMVHYRLNRLDAARRRARCEGRIGARFPWESADDGRDVTPREGHVGDEQVPILTGALEEHISADVAWAVVHHATWTRPDGGLTPDEETLVSETARYWASRITLGRGGSAHINAVIGPDEYHERVDDNAFTNVMARWNLRTAAHLRHSTSHERERWRALASALVDGFDTGTRRYEQFRGYFGLRPMLVRDFADPPVAADVLAGRKVIAGSQIIKQPDVLMIHHLLPHEAAPGSLAANLDYYQPRTAHGSSLSPAVMAALNARAGRPDVALDLLRLSLRIDLDDVGRTTAAGVHLGACAGAWQAVLWGFLGARVVSGALCLDPVLPTGWTSLEARFLCLGAQVRVRAEPDQLTVDSSTPLVVRVEHSRRVRRRTSSGVTFVRKDRHEARAGAVGA